MDIKLKIETIKSEMSIELSPDDVKNQYNALLDVIRDLEFNSNIDSVKRKIDMLDSILDLLGTMMLASEDTMEV
tara:strand:- start:13792 stop:14013 length:222 start_codon:yes stop_codon:yes gene_type:complete